MGQIDEKRTLVEPLQSPPQRAGSVGQTQTDGVDQGDGQQVGHQLDVVQVQPQGVAGILQIGKSGADQDHAPADHLSQTAGEGGRNKVIVLAHIQPGHPKEKIR